jgi:hypothetical protein
MSTEEYVMHYRLCRSYFSILFFHRGFFAGEHVKHANCNLFLGRKKDLSNSGYLIEQFHTEWHGRKLWNVTCRQLYSTVYVIPVHKDLSTLSFRWAWTDHRQGIKLMARRDGKRNDPVVGLLLQYWKSETAITYRRKATKKNCRTKPPQTRDYTLH